MSIDTRVGFMALSVLADLLEETIRELTAYKKGRNVYTGDPSYIAKYRQLQRELIRDSSSNVYKN